MTLTSRARLYWHYDAYVSFRIAALDYQNALLDAGVQFEREPYSSDIVIIQGSVETVSRCYSTYPELRNRYVVAFVQWEADRLPPWQVHILSRVDEIWTSSTFCSTIYGKYFKKVTVIPHVVKEPQKDFPFVHPLVSDLRATSPDEPFLYYTIVNKIEPRKNLEVAINAFQQLDMGSSVYFIAKTMSTQDRSALFRHPQIVHLNEWQSERSISALHHSAHTYISSHRGEGWGLGISEAMSYGNLVVATNYSGNTHYMNEQNSLPVSYELRPIDAHAVSLQPHLWDCHMSWADVDEADLRKKMAQAYYDFDKLEHLRLRAAHDMKEFRPERLAGMIARRIEEIVEHVL